jgi:hypothetical protein
MRLHWLVSTGILWAGLFNEKALREGALRQCLKRDNSSAREANGSCFAS